MIDRLVSQNPTEAGQNNIYTKNYETHFYTQRLGKALKL